MIENNKPLLFFSSPESAEREKQRQPYKENIFYPSKERQSKRIDGIFSKLDLVEKNSLCFNNEFRSQRRYTSL